MVVRARALRSAGGVSALSDAVQGSASQHVASSPPDQRPRRLMVRMNAVGDCVMMLPLLRQVGTHSRLEFLGRGWTPALLSGQPWLHAAHGLSGSPRPWWSPRGWFGRNHRDLARRFQASDLSEIIVFQRENPAVLRWIDRWRGATPLTTWDLPYRGTGPHLVDRIPPTLAAAGVDATGYDPLPRLTVSQAALTAARARLQPLGARVVAVQAGSSLTARWWRRRPNLKGLAHGQWAALIATVLARDADAVVLHGTAPEGREARAIRAALPAELRARVHDWTGRVPLRELPSILAASHAAISVDTGPGHIAAAVGCPLLTIFGPTDPALYAPRGPAPIELLLGHAPCQFCHYTPLWNTCAANVCLTGVSDAALAAAWTRLVEKIRLRSA